MRSPHNHLSYMTAKSFEGVFTALVTPFSDAGVDEAALSRLIERQIAGGVHGLVPVGTTGETSTLSHEEHKRVVSLCVEVTKGRVPVIAGAGSNSTAEAVEFVRHAEEAGADAVLVVTPYYNRPSQEGLFRHYEAVAGATALPVFVYNVPSRTSVDISNATLARLSAIPNIVGVKDATGDLSRPSLQRLECREGWVMLSGDDNTALGYIAHGGHGCISVTANIAPAACAQLMEAALKGDLAEARRLQDRLIRLHKALFVDASPSPTKFVLARMGLCREDARLPIAPCDPARHDEILAAVELAGAAP